MQLKPLCERELVIAPRMMKDSQATATWASLGRYSSHFPKYISSPGRDPFWFLWLSQLQNIVH